MGIAMLTATRVFAPMQGLFNWLMPPPEPVAFSLRVPPAPCTLAQRRALPVPIAPECAAAAHHARHNPQRPLRVVRVVDAGHVPCNAGRMVISGRMADVCAELDRLAACEATRH